MWGEIGTDKKALIAIQLDEKSTHIFIHAFPKEEVSKELQDELFITWKNGGDFTFPETAYQWTVDANSDTILPENIRVERPEIITQAQLKWSKKIMSEKVNQLLNEETNLILQNIDSITEYDQTLWDKAKQQWNKISDYQKKGEITWEQTTFLKEKINQVFDALKAVKRINNEHDDEKNAQIAKAFELQIDQLQNNLIYPDQWRKISDSFKTIQAELKESTVKWGIKRKLFDKINDIYNALRKYRSTELITKSKSRITQLNQILSGLNESIERDKENHKVQMEKMLHYTRGRMSEEEINSRFKYILDKIKDKEKKVANINKTIADIQKDIAKEELRQEQELKKEEEAQRLNSISESKISTENELEETPSATVNQEAE